MGWHAVPSENNQNPWRQIYLVGSLMIAKKRLQDELPAYALALLQRMHKVRGQIGDENFKFVSESISICGSPRVTLKALLEIKSKLFDIMGSLERIEAKNAALDAFNKNMMVE